MSSSRQSVAAGALVAAFVFFLLGVVDARAQGCVASRMNAPGGVVDPEGQSYYVPKGRWQTSFGYRNFRSHRHFVGSVEQDAENVANGTAARDRSATEVINHVNIPEFTVTYGISDRLSLNADVPYFEAHRRSPVSGDRPSFVTAASGIGDTTITGSFWVARPTPHSQQNLSIGLGIKMPTGNDRATDTFLDSVNPLTGERTTSVRPVDQSIQPGDGGWGIVAQFQAFKVFSRFTAFASGSYLSNPREQNDYLRNPTATNPDPSSAHYSIADQFGARVGVGTAVKRLGLSLAGRLEGVPSSDLIGGSMGWRRPGYSIAIEPGVSYSWQRYAVSLSVPIMVRRVRNQNISDKLATERTGVFRNGDAAFADYVVIMGFSRRF